MIDTYTTFRPCQALYPSEVLAYNARAKGLAMNGLWLNIVAFINTYAAPVGITNAGWKFYLLYLFVDVLGIGELRHRLCPRFLFSGCE